MFEGTIITVKSPKKTNHLIVSKSDSELVITKK